MTFAIDTKLHWTDHYAEYGFAVVKGLVDRKFCNEALREIRRLVDDDRPLTEWTSQKPGRRYDPFFQDPGRTGWTPQNPVLEKLYDQPGLRAAIDQMLGGPDVWDGARNYYMFLSPYEPDGEPKLSPAGHIDFPGQIVPTLYHGFVFLISLVQTDPFSGNMTIYPGTHKLIQKAIMDNPDLLAETDLKDVPCRIEPYEFVADPGDVMFVHHLVFHSGNTSHSANRKPRIALLAEVFTTKWLTVIDPDKPDLSPWERSLALNGYYQVQRDEASYQREKRKEYIDEIEKTRNIKVADKWKNFSNWPNP